MENYTPLKVKRSHITKLLKRKEPVRYQRKTQLFYKDHIPHGGYLVIEGSIIICSQEVSKQRIISPNEVLGLKESLMRRPFRFEAIAEQNTSLIFLDTSTYEELRMINILPSELIF